MLPVTFSAAARLQIWGVISQITEMAICFGIPAFLYYISRKSDGATKGRSFLLSVLAIWIGLILHRFLIGLPVALTRARLRGDFTYDGIGMNAAILVGGWLTGMITSAIVFAAFLAIGHFAKRQLPNDQVEPTNQRPGISN